MADHGNIQTLERINYSANESSNSIVVIAKDSSGDDVSISMSISVAADIWLHLADALKAIQVARGAPIKVPTTPERVTKFNAEEIEKGQVGIFLEGDRGTAFFGHMPTIAAKSLAALLMAAGSSDTRKPGELTDRPRLMKHFLG